MSRDRRSTAKAPRLFASKTRIPLPPPHFLSRPRLLASLREGLTHKLTLVVAAAGFGKTSLVAEVARELGPAAAWLTLDPGDHDLSVFVHYLVEAIATVRPGFGAETRAWLAATPTPAAQLEECAAVLADELESLRADRLVLFLDDFHEVAGSENITRLLDHLLRHLPPAVHLLVSTRSSPALEVTRLIVQQQVAGLGTDDLRFGPAEAASWFALRPEGLDSDRVRQLQTVAEGWVTGMILQSAADLPAQPATPSAQLYAYLLTEVLERQPADVGRFLLSAAILPHLTAALCAEVLDVPAAADLLHALYERQLFLTALGGRDPPVYRLHQLFREFLITRLRATDPAEFARLHRRAARYFAEHAEYGTAMDHLFAIGDWEAAAALAARVGQDELEAGRVERVERWIAGFPAAERDWRPALLVLQVRLLAAQSQYGQAGDVLGRAEHLFLAAGNPAGYAEVLDLRAQLAAARGDGRQMVDFAQHALAIPEAAAPIQAHAQHMAAIGYAFLGDPDRTDAAFAGALNAYSALNDVQSIAVMTSDWGYALTLREELNRASDQLARALDYARQANNSRLEANVLSSLALVWQIQGDLIRAETTLEAAGEIAHRLRWRRVEAEILVNRAENALERRGPETALPLYRAAADPGAQGAPATLVVALAGQARCLRRLGRYAEAAQAARRGLDAALAGEMPFEDALCRLELGAALLVSDTDAALPLLAAAEQGMGGLGRKREAARAAAILATALFAAYAYPAAEAALARAYATAARNENVSYLAPELATIYGLPLLRRAGGAERYAGLLSAVQQYLTAEHAEGAALAAPDSPLQLVRGRPYLIEVYSLGQAAVFRDGTPISRGDWQTVTAKELFFYLVEHPEGRRKEVVLSALWPDQTYSRANDNFHTSLRRLRAALGMDMVKVEDNLYRLNPALTLWYDGAEALGLIARAEMSTDPTAARHWMAAAAGLLQGPFAEEFYRDWAGARRQFWETRTQQVLSWLADDALRQGAFDDAVGWGRRLLAGDPLDESVHALLMRIFAAAGRPAMLLQQYNELCRALQFELGVEPSPETTALYRRLLAGGSAPPRKSSSP